MNSFYLPPLFVAAPILAALGIIAGDLIHVAAETPHLNHDIAWTQYAAGLLLDGGEFGVAKTRLNPRQRPAPNIIRKAMAHRCVARRVTRHLSTSL